MGLLKSVAGNLFLGIVCLLIAFEASTQLVPLPFFGPLGLILIFGFGGLGLHYLYRAVTLKVEPEFETCDEGIRIDGSLGGLPPLKTGIVEAERSRMTGMRKVEFGGESWEVKEEREWGVRHLRFYRRGKFDRSVSRAWFDPKLREMSDGELTVVLEGLSRLL
jgi:hypothetical protein